MTSWEVSCTIPPAIHLLASQREYLKLTGMTKETRLRIIIILALVAGYVLVAVLRSGTAW
jgi:hypothetical protein